jgi:hypothetical protein
MILSNKVYNYGKFIAQVGLPAFATLFLGIGQLWDVPNTEKVVATIVLLDTFLGVLLQISTRKYNKADSAYDGFLNSDGVHEDSGLPNLQMVITTDPTDLIKQDQVRLRVGKSPGK